MALTLLRHTTPDVVPQTCYGCTDLGLTGDFHDEATAAAKRLDGADRIVTSPLQRCHRLAEFLGNLWGVAPVVDERLREMDFGRWENRLWSDIPRTELDAWAEDFLHGRPHGGESVAMLQERTLKALSAIRQTKVKTLVVTHSGVIKAAFAKGNQPGDFATKIDFGHHIMWPLGEEDA